MFSFIVLEHTFEDPGCKAVTEIKKEDEDQLIISPLLEEEAMDEGIFRVESEEPFPGWLRIEVEGKKPSYRSPFPRTTITSAAKLDEFLQKEHSGGRMKDVHRDHFSFKRRLGLRQKLSKAPPHETDATHELRDGTIDAMEVEKDKEPRRGVVELLIKTSLSLPF